MRSWAASPDFVALILSNISETKPMTIVEAGCGVSTILAAYSVKKQGGGRILSLEHDEKYAIYCNELLKQHGLKDIATVFYAPLKEYNIGGETFQWYDTKAIEEINPINLLVVDGPPIKLLGQFARYPAMAMLHDKLSPGATVLMDDANRTAEQAVLARWRSEFPNLEMKDGHCEKGAAIIRKL